MKRRALRASVAIAISAALIGGCGGSSQDGTMVEVDKEKEEQLTKSMEQYYMQNEKPAKTNAKSK